MELIDGFIHLSRILLAYLWPESWGFRSVREVEIFLMCFECENEVGNAKNVYEMTTISKLSEACGMEFSAIRPKFQEMPLWHSDSFKLALEEAQWQKEYILESKKK